MEPEEQMIIKAYRRDYLGMFCFALYILQTIGMVAYMILLTRDYYHDYILFRGNQTVQASVSKLVYDSFQDTHNIDRHSWACGISCLVGLHRLFSSRAAS